MEMTDRKTKVSIALILMRKIGARDAADYSLKRISISSWLNFDGRRHTPGMPSRISTTTTGIEGRYSDLWM